MALAERTRQAIQQGRIAWDECLRISKLISRDEAAARSAVERAEACAARPQFECQPPERFWDALLRINKACGLDVPPSKDPDAVATALENSKHLTALAGLAPEREILERQVREDWQRRLLAARAR
jgi:prophage tail gpP-like protein